MGIDIYARWNGQTDAEEEAQYAGPALTSGHVGYLRESYHGEPYATWFLCKEAFESETSEAQIPAAVLRARLPEALILAEARQRTVYSETDTAAIAEVTRSFVDFVELCERKERETGTPVTIIASY
jgi:hypothetical protein